MTNNDMMAAIERVREKQKNVTYSGLQPITDMETVLALAEVGRLAVELRAVRNRKPNYDRPLAERVKHDGEDLRAYHDWSHAADAFLAKHGGGS